MKKAFLVGCGSLVVSGLLAAQSWAGAFSSDLQCLGTIKKGRVTIIAKGDVTGFIELFSRVPSPLSADCRILCAEISSAGPAPCINAKAGARILKIKAPGLGASLSGTCPHPSVEVVGICASVYTPPSL